MGWHVYEVSPIDFGWENLERVRDVAKKLAADEADRAITCDPKNVDQSCFMTGTQFMSLWRSAQVAAKGKGWEGDWRQEPVVFWLPCEEGFECGFVIKQDNNGTTYVVSPRKLPFLADSF